MASTYSQELEDLLATPPDDMATLRAAVLQLIRTLEGRMKSSDKSSLDFLKSALQLLSRLPAGVCPTGRRHDPGHGETPRRVDPRLS